MSKPYILHISSVRTVTKALIQLSHVRHNILSTSAAEEAVEVGGAKAAPR